MSGGAVASAAAVSLGSMGGAASWSPAPPGDPPVEGVGPSEMPLVLYGTAWKKERTAELVVQALLAGFRGIDTACQPKHYQEELVGRALAQAASEHGIGREEVFVQTKFTLIRDHDDNVPYDRNAPVAQQVEQSFLRSQRNLGVAVVDSLVLHSPPPTARETLEVWRAMEGIHQRGGARRLGISNCYDPALFQSLLAGAAVAPAVLQNRFHRKTGYDDELRRLCREHGTTYQAFWTLTANPHVLESPAVAGAAGRLRWTPAQVFFHFLVRYEGLLPLIGTCSSEHMKQDLDAVRSEPALSDAEAQQIRQSVR